ncbi:putative Calcium-transporting ATPase 8; plasma membrane-type [Paratrimastix pyriformis]|uniref:Calcium-transporting ATPase 8 n=1 Tax=Paratrimastix pyriformis TaxID=342808 RepID=A0ABQ8UC72_9EUKA|nr:putative Calcium-transporting ATPase 8; plasma membrane-type [Paratrimastix pyriformis]
MFMIGWPTREVQGRLPGKRVAKRVALISLDPRDPEQGPLTNANIPHPQPLPPLRHRAELDLLSRVVAIYLLERQRVETRRWMATPRLHRSLRAPACSRIDFHWPRSRFAARVFEEAHPLVTGLGSTVLEALASNARIHDQSHLSLRIQNAIQCAHSYPSRDLDSRRERRSDVETVLLNNRGRSAHISHRSWAFSLHPCMHMSCGNAQSGLEMHFIISFVSPLSAIPERDGQEGSEWNDLAMEARSLVGQVESPNTSWFASLFVEQVLHVALQAGLCRLRVMFDPLFCFLRVGNSMALQLRLSLASPAPVGPVPFAHSGDGRVVLPPHPSTLDLRLFHPARPDFLFRPNHDTNPPTTATAPWAAINCDWISRTSTGKLGVLFPPGPSNAISFVPRRQTPDQRSSPTSPLARIVGVTDPSGLTWQGRKSSGSSFQTPGGEQVPVSVGICPPSRPASLPLGLTELNHSTTVCVGHRRASFPQCVIAPHPGMRGRSLGCTPDSPFTLLTLPMISPICLKVRVGQPPPPTTHPTLSIILGAVFGYEESPPGYVDGIAILGTVLICTRTAIPKLNEQQKNRDIAVIRGGQDCKISIFDLVVGDVIKLTTGDMLPCDGMVFEATKISCEEAAMTGESNAIKKTPTGDCWMLCGCKVGEGIGKMVVTAVGMSSQFGILKSALVKPREQTALQVALGRTVDIIGTFGLFVAVATFLALVIRWSIDVATYTWETHYIKLLVDYLIIAVTIIVVAVPEGLPLAVTIALAFSMKRMLKDKNLVRRLESCEIMGGATSICSDKTGTLTQNRMTVTAGYFFDQFFNYEEMARASHAAAATAPVAPAHVEEEEVDEDEDPLRKAQQPIMGEILKSMQHFPPGNPGQLVFEGISLNTSASFEPPKLATDPVSVARRERLRKARAARAAKEGREMVEPSKLRVEGNKTDVALVNWIVAMKGLEFVPALRTSMHVIQQFPFSSEIKRAGTVIEMPDCYRFHCKGAAEIVTSFCRYMIDESGQVRIRDMAHLSLRCISVAYRDIPKPEAAPERGLILLGIAGIKDPLRLEVPAAVKDCQHAGITVRMVTGDNIETAKAIAKECGIYTPEEGGLAMEGPTFRLMRERELLEKVRHLQVLARSSPQDKLKLVKLLRYQLNEVVAVTGDGTNDAPALGQDASAIVLTDDNFVGIVKAVLWGRNVYDGIRKFVQFQLTINFVAIIVAFIGAIFDMTPLQAVQMLWVNLIMDSFAALALATDSPYKELLDRKPYGHNDPLICMSMWRNIATIACYEFLIEMLLLFLRDPTGKNMMFFPRVPAASVAHNTIMFNTFIFMQIGNMFCSRRAYNEINFFAGIFKNWLFVAIWLLIAGLQIIIIEVEAIGMYVFKTVPLDWDEWLFCVFVGLATLPLGLFVRVFRCPDPMDPVKRKRDDETALRLAIYRARRKEEDAKRRWNQMSHRFGVLRAFRSAYVAEASEAPIQPIVMPPSLMATPVTSPAPVVTVQPMPAPALAVTPVQPVVASAP